MVNPLRPFDYAFPTPSRREERALPSIANYRISRREDASGFGALEGRARMAMTFSSPLHGVRSSAQPAEISLLTAACSAGSSIFSASLAPRSRHSEARSLPTSYGPKARCPRVSQLGPCLGSGARCLSLCFFVGPLVSRLLREKTRQSRNQFKLLMAGRLAHSYTQCVTVSTFES